MEQSLATLAAHSSEEYQRGREHQGVSFSHPVRCTVKRRNSAVGAGFRDVSGKFSIKVFFFFFLHYVIDMNYNIFHYQCWNETGAGT